MSRGSLSPIPATTSPLLPLGTPLSWKFVTEARTGTLAFVSRACRVSKLKVEMIDAIRAEGCPIGGCPVGGPQEWETLNNYHAMARCGGLETARSKAIEDFCLFLGGLGNRDWWKGEAHQPRRLPKEDLRPWELWWGEMVHQPGAKVLVGIPRREWLGGAAIKCFGPSPILAWATF